MSTDVPKVVSFKAGAELRRWLKERAAQGYRTVSAEIVMLLEERMKQQPSPREGNHGA